MRLAYANLVNDDERTLVLLRCCVLKSGKGEEMRKVQPTIAIVGSGPSGCYVAQFLRKKWPDAEITVFESLPVPYGLVRYGVSSDHQGTKSVTAQFDRLFERDGVHFAGNVRVGADVAFESLSHHFDVVVLAMGLKGDRRLAVDVAPGCSVIGAGAVLRALNGYPETDLPRLGDGTLAPLGERVAVVGNGNVAMDVIRLLCKPRAAFTGTDIDDQRLDALRAARIKSIDVFGRSPATDAKCDLSMLKEILVLPSVRVGITGLEDDEDCPVASLLRASAMANAMEGTEIQVNFHFSAVPCSVKSGAGVNMLSVERVHDRLPREFAVHSLITAIGFTNGTVMGGHAEHAGWVGSNVFRVGWLNRDGKGTIADNRRDAKAVAETIIQRIEAGELALKGLGFKSVEGQIGHAIVNFDGWRRIDAYERTSAAQNRCRRKITDVAEMILIAASRLPERRAGIPITV